MKNTLTLSVREPGNAEIRHAAYLLWLEAGRPHGRDQEHWFAAKERLIHQTSRVVKTRRSAASVRSTIHN